MADVESKNTLSLCQRQLDSNLPSSSRNMTICSAFFEVASAEWRLLSFRLVSHVLLVAIWNESSCAVWILFASFRMFSLQSCKAGRRPCRHRRGTADTSGQTEPNEADPLGSKWNGCRPKGYTHATYAYICNIFNLEIWYNYMYIHLRKISSNTIA